ncbi:TPA: hypothetical protein NIA41_000442 [Pseudomonas aeruginosa]|nr:hypothetical protein [Pseudomonas aeruginosa]
MDLYAVVARHALRSLQQTARCFSEYLRGESMGPLRIDGFEHRLAAQQLGLWQTVSSKLFGRVYSCQWRWLVAVDCGAQSMSFRLRFRGWRAANRMASFEGTPCAALELLNSSGTVLELCAAMDVAELEVRYVPDERCWRFHMRPSYGDYVWLLIPPVKYVRHPNAAEVDSTMLLIHELSLLCRRAVAGREPG